MNTQLLTRDEAVAQGYAKFNNGPHLCVDIPNGGFTISARTSEGKLITFAFCPYADNGPPQCVDVQCQTPERTVMNGDFVCPVQRVICFTTGRDTFRSTVNDEKPTTLVTVILQHEKDNKIMLQHDKDNIIKKSLAADNAAK